MFLYVFCYFILGAPGDHQGSFWRQLGPLLKTTDVHAKKTKWKKERTKNNEREHKKKEKNNKNKRRTQTKKQNSW